MFLLKIVADDCRLFRFSDIIEAFQSALSSNSTWQIYYKAPKENAILLAYSGD